MPKLKQTPTVSSDSLDAEMLVQFIGKSGETASEVVSVENEIAVVTNADQDRVDSGISPPAFLLDQ